MDLQKQNIKCRHKKEKIYHNIFFLKKYYVIFGSAEPNRKLANY